MPRERLAGGRGCRRGNFDGCEALGEPGLLAIRSGAMNHSRFGGLVERGGQTFEGGIGLGLFAGLHQLVIGFLEGLEARFDGVVAHLFSGAAPNALLG